jgi:hypothetical protein
VSRLRGGQGGFITLQFVVAAGLSLLLVAVAANLVVYQYGRGVVRVAVDEAARAGSRVADGAEECERRGGAVLADLLGGAMGHGVTLRCADDGAAVSAAATVHFQGWAPGVGDWRFDLSARVARR